MIDRRKFMVAAAATAVMASPALSSSAPWVPDEADRLMQAFMRAVPTDRTPDAKVWRARQQAAAETIFRSAAWRSDMEGKRLDAVSLVEYGLLCSVIDVARGAAFYPHKVPDPVRESAVAWLNALPGFEWNAPLGQIPLHQHYYALLPIAFWVAEVAIPAGLTRYEIVRLADLDRHRGSYA